MMAGRPGTLGLTVLLVLAFGPMVVLLPHPPAYLQAVGGAVLVAGVGLAVRRHIRATPQGHRTMRTAAAVLCLATVAATAANIALQPVFVTVPTFDVLPWAFGLQGEDINDAVLFEVWFELWLLCLVVLGSTVMAVRVMWRRLPGHALSGRRASPGMLPPW